MKKKITKSPYATFSMAPIKVYKPKNEPKIRCIKGGDLRAKEAR